MVNGTTLFKLGGNTYYSPTFPQGGQAAIFAVDVTDISGGPTFTIGIETRTAASPTWTQLDTFANITVVGVATKDVTDLNEFVRLSFKFAAGDDAIDAVHFVVMPPAWRQYN